MKKGECYYRARLFDTFFLNNHKKEIKELETAISQYYPKLSGKSYEETSYIFNSPMSWPLSPIYKKLIDILKRKKRFWGYGEKESDAPPYKKASAGRANPDGISYLYLCDSINAAIMEVRPLIGQDVSVAEIKILDDIKLFDFCTDLQDFSKGGDIILHHTISRAFLLPYTGDIRDYYPTQYLCEYIKELGFEGIRYHSSIDNSAKNIVIFNTSSNETGRKVSDE